jgi:hypothetical protein
VWARCRVLVLSRVRGSVTNNKGFWIGLLDLLALLLQLQPTATAHNQWPPKTRSIPYWPRNVFSSAVNNFVLMSVTSSASAVRWLTLHSWTVNYWTALWILLRLTNAEWRLTTELNLQMNYVLPFYNSGPSRIEITISDILCTTAALFVVTDTCISEPLSSN